MNVDYSHDDDFEIQRSGVGFSALDFNGKYTDLRLPLPAGKGYTMKGVLRYGDLKYPKAGLNETKYIKDHDKFEIQAVAADGSETLKVIIEGHDCRINLEN